MSEGQLCPRDDPSRLLAATQRRAKPFSSLRERAKTSRERAAKLSLLDYDWKPLCVEGGGARAPAGTARPPPAPPAPLAPPPHYIGVCLPRDLAHIFPSDFTGSYGDYDTNDKEPTKMDKNSTLLGDSITGAEVKRTSQFVEVDVSSSTDVSRLSSTTARTLTDKNIKDNEKEGRTEEAKEANEASKWRHAVNECLVCVRTRPPSSNELREAFFLGLEAGEEARRGEERPAPQAELLRHVRFMSNPIYLRQTRSALLSIKQRHPEVFRSACVYSDVCAHLARDTYLLCARRFLHELFLDADFDCFRDDSANLLARHASPMLPETTVEN